MAISTNELLKGASGKYGDMLLRQMDGQTVLSPLPENTGKPGSPRQKAMRQHFGKGTATIKWLFKQDPELKAYYQEVAGPNKKAFNAAMRAWVDGSFTAAPVQPAVRRPKDVPVCIQLPAGMNIGSMQLCLTDKDGSIIEVTPVLDSKTGKWVCVATAVTAATAAPVETRGITAKNGRQGQEGQKMQEAPMNGTASLLPVYREQGEGRTVFLQTRLPVFTSTLSVGSP